VSLKDGFAFAAGASMVLTASGKHGSGQDSKRVALRFLNDCPFNLGVSEVMATLGTLEHPAWHGTPAAIRCLGWVKGRQTGRLPIGTRRPNSIAEMVERYVKPRDDELRRMCAPNSQGSLLNSDTVTARLYFKSSGLISCLCFVVWLNTK
jgi:hypothetical protein